MLDTGVAVEALQKERESIAIEIASGLADYDAGKCASTAMRALHTLDSAICMLCLLAGMERKQCE